VNALSAGLVVVAIPTSLAFAIGGMCDIAAVAFGLLWLSVAAGKVTAWARGRFRFPALTGRRVRLAVLSAVWAVASVVTALYGWLGATAVFGTGSVLTALYCAVPARDGCPQWTDEELAALDDEADLEELLDAMPVTRRERKLR
jgi:hypothetical protein